MENSENAIVSWESQLAEEAKVASTMEASASGGQFFSLKGGILAWDGQSIPGNQMAVVILDSIFENVYYAGKYDPDSKTGPSCFAFGRDEVTISPHISIQELGRAISNRCGECPKNEWASADTGKGKACRNTRRLAMIPAGSFSRDGKFELIDDPEHYKSAQIGFIKLPVTSVRGYATYVRQAAVTLKRPPHGIVTRVKVQPDAKTQFKVTFDPIVNLPNEVMSVIMTRHEEAMATIDFPYTVGKAEGKIEETQQTKPGRKY
jgi:hypothetical protein